MNYLVLDLEIKVTQASARRMEKIMSRLLLYASMCSLNMVF